MSRLASRLHYQAGNCAHIVNAVVDLQSGRRFEDPFTEWSTNAATIDKGQRTKMKNICLMALVVLFSFTAFGVNDVKDETPDKLNGTELAMSCQESTQGFDAGYCLGVVEGVISTSKKVCNHSAISLGDAVDVVTKYIKDNPDKLNKRDAVLVREALSKAYPCSFLK